MIYLFSNLPYGARFLEIARSLASKRGANVVVVFSARDLDISLLRRKTKELKFYIRKGISVRLVEDVNADSFRRRLKPGDHGIIAGFSQIFRQETIEDFATLVNFHSSILPLYRGPVPSYWCIRNGEKCTGFTLHKVTKKIDQGEILYQEAAPIEETDTPEILKRRIFLSASKTFEKYLEFLLDGGKWEKREVDAFEIYENHVGYATFPGEQDIPRVSPKDFDSQQIDS